MDPLNVTSKFNAIIINGNIPSTNYSSGALQIKGGMGISGDIYTNGTIASKELEITNLNVLESITYANGDEHNEYVLTSDNSGNALWKTKYFNSNDEVQLTDAPSDNNIWTYHNIGIGTTSPQELLHVYSSTAGEGAIIGNAMIGNWLENVDSCVVVHKDLKTERNYYALRQSSYGNTSINSNDQINFKLRDALQMVISPEGFVGIGITNPQECLHIAENCIIQGNLEVQGSTISFDTETIQVEDSLIHVGNGNVGDIIDIGLYGSYVSDGVTKYCAFYRDASEEAGKFKLIDNLLTEPTTTVASTGYTYGTLRLGGMEELVGITFNNNAEINMEDLTFSYGTRPGPYSPFLFFKDGNVGFGVTEPQAKLDLKGNLAFDGFLGIGMSDPQVSIDNDATDAIRLPYGTNDERPSIPKLGYFRYNTDRNTVEIYNSDGWSTLASVVDVDGDTYIDPERTEDDDTLRFYTYNEERMVINGDGWIGIGVTNPEIALDMTGHTNAFGVPKGTSVERPTDPKTGYLRFNTTLNILEAYDGTAWTNIAGGTTDFDSDTKILAESYNGADEDFLKFYTAGSERMIITSDGLIGVNNMIPNVSFQIDTVDALKIPVGTSDERPLITEVGQIRYNSQLEQFEGFGAGDAWGSLGGVKDIDQDTYITAELNPDEDKIRVVTNDLLRMIIDNNGNVGIGVTYPSVKLDVDGDINADNVYVANDVIVTGNLTVSGNNTVISTVSLMVDDSMVQLGMSNLSDELDIGLFGQFIEDGVTKYTGCMRDASDGIYKLYTNLLDVPGAVVNTAGVGYTKATFQVGTIDTENVSYPVDLKFNDSDVIFKTSGYVGIGCDPQYPLHITKSNITNWSSRITNGSVNVYTANSSGMGITVDTGVDSSNLQTALKIGNSSISSLLQVNNSGRVGISTSNPSKLFHVYTTVAGEGAQIGNASIGVWPGLNTTTYFANSNVASTEGSYAIKQKLTGDTSVNSASGRNIDFCVNNVCQMRMSSVGYLTVGNGISLSGDLDCAGNLFMGIDTPTSNNTQYIHLNSTTGSTGIHLTNGTTGTTANNGLNISLDDSDCNIMLYENANLIFSTYNTERVRIDSNGLVGIGTNVPETNLSIQSSVAVPLIVHTSNSDSSMMLFRQNGSTTNQMYIGVNGEYFFAGNNTGVSSGTLNYNFVNHRLGIGTDEPLYTLHVNGDTRVDGNVYIGGNITYDGAAVESLFFQDSLLKFASDNTTDLLDIGFFGRYENFGTTKYAGIFRDCTDNKIKLFVDLTSEPTTEVDTDDSGYTDATLVIGKLEASDTVSGVDFLTISDQRVKENIKEINCNQCLTNINELNVYEYNFKEGYGLPNKKYNGLIAQEVQKVIPEAIEERQHKDMDDFKTINQNIIISQLIGCIKTLTERVNNLENRLLKYQLDNV